MTERELVRGEVNAFEAATAFNAPVYHSYAHIIGVVRLHLGFAAAVSFAKPVLVGGQIVWTTEVAGPIRGWADLEPAERRMFESLRKELGTSLDGLVNRLRQGGINTRSGNLSHLLGAALVVPSPRHLYLVGDRLVLAFWGFRQLGDRGLDPFCDAPLVPPSPTPLLLPTERHRQLWPWLLICLLTLLLAAGVWWLRSHDIVQPAPISEPVVQPPPVPAPPPPPPEPESKPVDPASPAPPAPVRTGTLLHMPQNGDLSSLQGCWQTDRFKYGNSYGVGVSTYCFDKQGQGRLSHVEARQTCDAPAHVDLRPDGSMYLVDQDSICSDGGRWYRDRLICKGGPDGVAYCSGQGNVPGEVVRWTTTLHRR